MPFDVPTCLAGLAATAHARLAERFAAVGHRPSAEQWSAIADLLTHLELAADGQLATALYVSAIPAGTGKSQSLAAFATALMDDPTRSDTGMLITVNRITEAHDMALALADYRKRLCVITSDAAVNALGDHDHANAAQVCISTQAALKNTLKALAGPFASASRFHYRGQRRAVVCWDEAFAFNRPVTLNVYSLGGVATAMQRQSDVAARTLMRWAADLADGGEGLRLVPDFKALGVDFRQLEDDAAERDDLLPLVKGLAVMSGGQGFTMRGDFGGATLITHYPEIPASLMPLIVTDASAKVNASYAQMAGKVPVRWLAEATKTYSNMTIHLAPAAASRSVYRDRKTARGRELIDMAVRYIRSVAPEEVLVVSYKGRMAIRDVAETTIAGAIDARLSEDEKWIDKASGRRRVHHLTWGRHTATNEFRHVSRVILMGLNFLPTPASHAAAGAALDLDLLTQHPTETQIEAQRRGMLKDATLQAVLRGNARIGADGDCGPMEVVIPQTKQTGLSEDEYRQMFPGVRLIADTVLMPPKALKGRLGELQAIVARRLQAGETQMSNPSLYGEMGISKQQFAALVRKPEWQAYIAAAGLRPQPLAGRCAGLRLVA